MLTSSVAASRARLLSVVRLLPVTILLASSLAFTPGASADGLDTDADGLYDADEIGYYLTNPSLADSDGDGLSDGEEVYYGTDPRVANAAPAQIDSDGDGLYDLDESGVYFTNPNLADTDGDGVSDGAEIYNGTDPLAGAAAPAPDPGDAAPAPDAAAPAPAAPAFDPNADFDQDGLGNDQEIRAYFTDPNVFDTDQDGLSDGFEITTAGTNPLLYDSFGHGSSDAETYQRRVQHQGAPAGTEDQQPPMAELPAEGDACRIEGACGGGDMGPDPTHQHCFLEEQQDPALGDRCGN